ncbi:MAG: hemerythrin domain-containing protein [Micromonosporaceae bacterium]|jgi:hypothetical protein|nr:hemerythrin domain-containing protein [Micromonosporaceae bacterium]
MCEYCGCQTLDPIDCLTREHDLVVGLIGELRQAHRAGDGPRMAQISRRIAAILAPHTRVEEDGLFPAFRTEFPDHIDALVAEHRRIESVLDEAAEQIPGDPTWPDRLLTTMDVLRDHILKEQDGVFPAALATLSTEDWEAVQRVRAQVGTLLPAEELAG